MPLYADANPKMTSGDVLIYGISDTVTGEVRYVGKTSSSLTVRASQHVNKSKRSRSRLSCWLRKTVSSRMFVIEMTTEDAWEDREVYWISHYRREYNNLLNVTDGGAGCYGMSQTYSHKEKRLVKLRKGAQFICERDGCWKVFWRKPFEISRGNARYCCRECFLIDQVGKSKNIGAPVAAIAVAAALRRSATHCKHGHQYSEENTKLNSRGARVCRECGRITSRKYWHNKKQREICDAS